MEITSKYKISGIYCITNKITGNCYIGSSKFIYGRLMKHRSMLRGASHSNEYLQNAYNKYGESNFTIRLLEITSDLLIREQFWIDNQNPEYNLMKEAKRSYIAPKTAKKISKSLKKHYKKHNSASQKPVYVYCRFTGTFLEEYPSKTVCSSKLGISWDFIQNSINRKRSYKYPYIITNVKHKKVKPRLNKKELFNKNRKQYVINGKTYYSLSQAARDYDIKDRTFRRWYENNSEKIKLLIYEQDTSPG